MTHAECDIRGLWHAYKCDCQQSARDELILHYAPLVHVVAGRIAATAPRHVDRSDLVSYGVFGLIDAVERFEPARGVRFETYAMARIKGHILDELRSFDWVPRSVRAKARAIDAALGVLQAELHRSPTDAELACALGMADDELQRVLSQVALVNLVTFDSALSAAVEGEQGLTVGDVLVAAGDGPGDQVELAETRRALAHAIELLSDRERQVVSLYYFDGLTLAEIGSVLGVTESRACQIHSKVVAQLRRRLTTREHELA
ncbi:MAG TPA: FliA/WhiG family RNA polymerase sigma factor [Acidimicrobiales bacterium]|nr:FliA/WhiG family RNA polymerase sigma factor [Acidimicrobiales bacterium]